MSSPKDTKSSLPVVTKTEGAYHPSLPSLLSRVVVIVPSRLSIVLHHNKVQRTCARIAVLFLSLLNVAMTNHVVANRFTKGRAR
jgi:hypothetical protein